MTNSAPPPNTIGYFAIILPEINEFSGGFITDNPDIAPQVNMTMANAMIGGSNAYGTLAALMVEGATTGRPDIVAIASRAYAALTKERFFYVIGYKEPGGTRTDIRLFEARDVELAREELNNLPEVLAIKEHVMTKMKGQKPN